MSEDANLAVRRSDPVAQAPKSDYVPSYFLHLSEHTAAILGVTMSQLARLIRHDKLAFAMVNQGRTTRGLPALK